MNVPERLLTPRAPYQSSPLSFLLAYNSGWSLYSHDNELQWVSGLTANLSTAELDAWFKNVTPGTTAVITLTLSIATGTADEGLYSIWATGADPVQFPVTGFRQHTVDVVVRPDDSTVIVSLTPVSGIDLINFTQIAYCTID